jgi:hypothetical protein
MTIVGCADDTFPTNISNITTKLVTVVVEENTGDVIGENIDDVIKRGEQRQKALKSTTDEGKDSETTDSEGKIFKKKQLFCIILDFKTKIE